MPQLSVSRWTRVGLAFLLLASTARADGPKDAVVAAPFGKLDTGEPVVLYTLTNHHGTSVSIMNYGATIVRLMTRDVGGQLGDICLGFDDFAPYPAKSPYFGATIGRYGNRIAKGHFELDRKTYTLATNNGPNSLHGGLKGFDKQMWQELTVSQSPPEVQFTRTSPDGEEGYPGTLKVAVTFELTDADQLKLTYQATTDRDTILNLTNHTYFNLSGKGTIENELLTIDADRYTPVDATLIPTGELAPVENTPFDFRMPTAIGQRLAQAGGTPVGYDHNFVLNAHALSRAVVKVSDPASGRWMKLYTDQPGLQFYSGNFLDGTVTGKGGVTYQKYGAFCLETQHFPDSPNHANFPTVVLKPGKSFRSQTIYAFGAK